MFLTQEEVKEIGFKHVGKDVKISSSAVFYKPERMSIGDYTRIDDLCVLSDTIVLGRHVHVSTHCSLIGDIVVGDFVSISFHALIMGRSDDFSGAYLTNPTVNSKYRNVAKSKVTINDYSVLGARTTILPGVTIDEGVATGAHSFVKKSTESWSIYAGCPAQKIGDRDKACIKHTTHLK